MLPHQASPPFVNPGELFLTRHGPPRQLDDVLAYARWLRLEADISEDMPLDLGRIYTRFHMPTPRLAPLPGPQGLLVDAGSGLVLVNEADPRMRQRFTEAHELVEFYFQAAVNGEGEGRSRPSDGWKRRKENWCDEAAGELLVPRASVRRRIQEHGVCFATARNLAAEFRVSLTASLCQMIKASNDHHAVIHWRVKNKPTELTLIAATDGQPMLFGKPEDRLPKKRLRVEWSFENSEAVSFPVDKSVDEDTAVHAVWREGRFTSGDDRLGLGKRVLSFTSENQPFEKDGERHVLTLATVRV